MNTATDLTTRAREIAEGLTRTQRTCLLKAMDGERYRHGNGYLGDRVRTSIAKLGLTTSPNRYDIRQEPTDLGRAVAAVLAGKAGGL